jgi:hypothetical protein
MNEIRYRVLRCAEELAAVPIEEVAKIAAMLVTNPARAAAKEGLARKGGDDRNTAQGKAKTQERVNQENPLVAATAKAFELLEIAYYGNLGLKDTGSYEAGLAKFVEDERNDEQFLEGIASRPKWQWQDTETASFDKALAVLMPKIERAGREARFKGWLNDRCKGAKPEQDDQERMIEVGEHIAKMKTSGIPRMLFGQACVTLNDEWWNSRISESRFAAGKKGGRPRADTQDQVAQNKSSTPKTTHKFA